VFTVFLYSLHHWLKNKTMHEVNSSRSLFRKTKQIKSVHGMINYEESVSVPEILRCSPLTAHFLLDRIHVFSSHARERKRLLAV